MADRALAAAAHVTFGENDPEACGTIGSRRDPLESGLVNRPGETGLAAVMVTSCARRECVSRVGCIRQEAASSPLIQQSTLNNSMKRLRSVVAVPVLRFLCVPDC
jgi:hypothetical protein